jgi:hypothetical protein
MRPKFTGIPGVVKKGRGAAESTGERLRHLSVE